MHAGSDARFEAELSLTQTMMYINPDSAISMMQLLWDQRRDPRVLVMARLIIPQTTLYEIQRLKSSHLAFRLDVEISAQRWGSAARLYRDITGKVAMMAAYTPHDGGWTARLNTITAAEQARRQGGA